MDIAAIQQEEARYIQEMQQGISQQQTVQRASLPQQMFRETSEIQRRSDHIKMRMIAGDRDISMADVVKADSESKVAFSKASVLVKRVSEGLKTVLNSPL